MNRRTSGLSKPVKKSPPCERSDAPGMHNVCRNGVTGERSPVSV
jgi:hypothetical protein